MRQQFLLPSGHLLPDAYSVVACESCGMVYADTPAPQQTYDQYYADASKYSGAGTGISVTDAARYDEVAAEIGRHFSVESRIADVGSGNGGLVFSLRRIGFRNAIGVDPSPTCASLLGDAGRVGSLWELDQFAQDVDCFVLSHVLEHVQDVPHAVEALSRTNAAVYVEVPDATRYGECIVAPFQDINVEHINHFSQVSLGNALATGGFRVVERGSKTIESSPGMPYPAIWAIARRDSECETITRDIVTAPAMRQYIERSRAELAGLDARLRRSLSPGDDIVIWGIGQTVLTALPQTVLSECIVHAFIDGNPLYHGRTLGAIPVHAPESLREYPYPVVIGSIIHETAIRTRIQQLGVQNRLVSLA
jgi:hypothetical protein